MSKPDKLKTTEITRRWCEAYGVVDKINKDDYYVISHLAIAMWEHGFWQSPRMVERARDKMQRCSVIYTAPYKAMILYMERVVARS